MSISGIQAGNNVDILRMQNLSGSTAVQSNSLAEVSDEFTESDETSKFKEIVGKYDITNMSYDDMVTMYAELYNNKLISVNDLPNVVKDITKICIFEDGKFHTYGVGKGCNPVEKVSPLETVRLSSKPYEKFNFLDTFQAQVDWTKENSDLHKDGQSELGDAQSKLELAEKIHYFQT